jgi:hypothetical protein
MRSNKRNGRNVLYFEKSVFINVLYIILWELDFLRICDLLQDVLVLRVKFTKDSMCDFTNSTCAIILWQVWLRNHVRNTHIPWFSTAFTICDFSCILHVDETRLRSSSANENLCLRRSLYRTKWCMLVVDSIKIAARPLGKLVWHLRARSLLFQLLSIWVLYVRFQWVRDIELLHCLAGLKTCYMCCGCVECWNSLSYVSVFHT